MMFRMSAMIKRIYLSFYEMGGVPDVRQNDVDSCGVASVQAVLAYYGIDKRSDELKVLLKTDDNGTTPEHLEAVLRSFGLDVDNSLKSVNELKEIVGSGVPVIVDVQAWPEHTTDLKRDYEDGHYMVLVGLTDDSFIIEDPAMFGRVKIKFSEFVTRWHDEEADGSVENHLSVVVRGPRKADKTIHDIDELEKRDLQDSI